jgi:hypothetical protein
MSKRKLTAAALLAVCSTALGVENGGQVPAAAEQLMQLYPGSYVAKDQGRVRTIYGVPMTPGLDARGAASLFIQQHGQAFGCGALNVQEDWTADFADGSKTVFVYQQFLSGYPVEYGTLKVLVLNGPVPRVVYAGGTLAPAPEAAFAAKIPGEAAVAAVRAMPVWKKLPSWGQPQLVVWQGEGDWTAPVLTWKFTGESAVPSDKLHKTFFVNASTGAIEYIREDVHYTDVGGSTKGWGSPGLYPDATYNPPALMNIPDMRAQITGGGSAYSSGAQFAAGFPQVSGLFNITNPGATPVDVSCAVNGAGVGQWVTVIPQTSVPITASVLGITPPGPADLVLNATPPPSELTTAQVNAFICTSVTHDFIKHYAPSLTRWDTQLQCNTAVSGTCNAFFTTTGGVPNINFYNSGGGCSNTAYTTVVSHEYGHFIVSHLGANGSGLTQGAFGEGYGDVNAELIWDDYVTGRGFRGTQNSFVRDPIAANIQYPCSSGQCSGTEIHCCGQILSGVWWRIRSNLGTALGEPAGLETARQLEVNWALITLGGSGANSAYPTTAIEVLTADDNDGNINNGTPHYTQICPGFAAHSIQCPAITLLAFQYPSGRPVTLVPNTPTNIPVNVTGVSGTPQPNTGTLTYRVNGGSFTTIPMTQGSPNQYTATLPGVPCNSSVDYYVSAQTTTAATQSDPNNAPASTFSTISAASSLVVNLNFEVDPGWTVTNTALTSGGWERGVPVAPGTSGAPGSDYDGSGQCWVTDNRLGAEGFADVDGGPTVLTTNAFDLSGYASATVSYARYLESHNGVTDSLVFQVSSDNGANWTTLESATTQPVWTVRTFNVPTLTSQVMFRWSIADNPNDSVTEAGIDAFRLVAINCSSAPCYPNCDSSTTAPVLNVQDFSCFLNRFAAGDTWANCDNSTTAPVLNVQDFSCFLNSFAAGCS